jgi:hypothetical protein
MAKQENAPAAAPRTIQTVQTADAMFTRAVEASMPKDGTEHIGRDNLDELTRLDDESPEVDESGHPAESGPRKVNSEARKRSQEEGTTEAAADALADILRSAEDDAFEDDPDGDPNTEDADDAEDDESEDADGETYRVKVDGEEVEVTLEEALKGYQRQAAFTRRMQEVADTRREAESLRDQAGTAAEQYAMQGAALLRFAESALSEPAKQQIQASVQRAIADAQAVQAHRVQETLQTESRALREAMGWQSDEDVAAGRQALVQAAKEYGYEPQELSGVYDHRLLVILNDAAAFRAMQGKGKEAREAAKASRKRSPTLSPGNSNSRRPPQAAKAAKAARARLASSGSLSDAADVLAGLIDV